MRKTLPISLLAVSALLCSCSLGRLLQEETRRENVRIYMNDGDIIAGESVLPDLKDRKIDIKGDNGGKIRIAAGDTEAAIFTQGNHPEIRNIFVYRDFVKSSGKTNNKGPFWMLKTGSGKGIEICLCGAYYSFDKDGQIKVEAAPGDRVCVIGFKDDGQGEFIGYDDSSTTTMRNAMVEWLADDPALCQKLANREIKAKDYQAICSAYNPQPAGSSGASFEI